MAPGGANPGRGDRARRRALRRPALLRAIFAIAAAFGALALAGALSSCGTGTAGSDAPPFPRGSTGGALPGDTLVAPSPEWAPRGYAIEPVAPETRRLDGGAEGLDALLRTIEAALAARDSRALERVMIDEREFREILYPSLPVAHPPISARFETVWATHYPDAHRGVGQALRRFGGQPVEIRVVRFEAPDQDLVNFALHETSRVDLVVGDRTLTDVRLFGSVVVVDGRWKVLSYPDDP